MAENLMNSDHKATNKNFRDGYENTSWEDKDDKSNSIDSSTIKRTPSQAVPETRM